ncbi:uncharacterized protein LOC115329451 [Ixodes scapularis]|uniref:uncharacterized protein LOC115329451 n=1 Tax=Ixodes scapularis TaxID=6945 RepID=UPI001A9D7A2C|nr:uncharacterized protein LOC115329451 [Ixodes scapularis]
MDASSVLLAIACLCVAISSGVFGQTPTSCESDADCIRGQRCVLHGNFSQSANCETYHTCIPVANDGCTCNPGYACYMKFCIQAPFECLVLEDLNSRCGGSEGPKCSSNEVCGYRRTFLSCIKCPCYGTHEAVCVPRDPENTCHRDSMVQVERDGTSGYVCKGCASPASVLTARNRPSCK